MPFLTSGRSRFLGGSRVPPAPVPVAGAEMLADGGFETWVSDTNATHWGEVLLGASKINRDSTEPYAGTYCARMDVDGSNSTVQLSQAVAGTNAGMWSMASCWIKSSVAGKTAEFGGTVLGVPAVIFALASVWQKFTTTQRSAGLGTLYLAKLTAASSSIFWDDASCVPLFLSSLISTRPYASADCDISVAITRTAGTQAGFAVRVDDPANPQNFIIAYLDGAGNVKVDKCVAGTYTNAISGAVTYADGRVLRLVCSGNDVSAYYHGTQVGTTQTVSDAGIVSNKNHGLFSTYAANTFTGYVAA